jgi:hypothetical protein
VPVAPDLKTFQTALGYWLEEPIYATTLSTLGPLSTQTLFNVQNWQGQGDQALVAEVHALGATQAGQTQWNVTTRNLGAGAVQPTRSVVQLYSLAFPPALGTVRVGGSATTGLSLSVTETENALQSNVQVLYRLRLWRMTIIAKVVAGIPLTDAEKRVASRLNLSVDPADQPGTLPIPLRDMVRRLYEAHVAPNRAVLRRAPFAQPNPEPFLTVQANTGELLVLVRAGTEADPDDQVLLRVERDTQTDYLELDASCLSLDGVPCFVPANDHLSFSVTAPSVLALPTPVSLEVWRVSLTTILQTRLGLLGIDGLTQLLGSAAAAQREQDRILAGVV